jgi:hypothetical protein
MSAAAREATLKEMSEHDEQPRRIATSLTDKTCWFTENG